MRRPENFWSDPFVRRLSDEAKLILRWAWDNADADGRLAVSAGAVLAGVWPLRSTSTPIELLGRSTTCLPPKEHVRELLRDITESGRWIMYPGFLPGQDEIPFGGPADVHVVQLRSFRRFMKPRDPAPGDLPEPPADLLADYQKTWGDLDVRQPGKESADKEKKLRDATRRIFAAWVKLTDRDESRVKLTRDRMTKVMQRLREGITEQQILDAVRYVQGNGFLMGQEGKRKGAAALDDLVDVCRSAARIEKWSAAHNSGGSAGDSDSDIDRLREEARERTRKHQLAQRALPKRRRR